MFENIKNFFLDLINYCDCPFDPEDNPFPQSCDKRIIFTDECEKCSWRKDFEREKTRKNPIARNEHRKIYMCQCGNKRVTTMDNFSCVCGAKFDWSE